VVWGVDVDPLTGCSSSGWSYLIPNVLLDELDALLARGVAADQPLLVFFPARRGGSVDDEDLARSSSSSDCGAVRRRTSRLQLYHVVVVFHQDVSRTCLIAKTTIPILSSRQRKLTRSRRPTRCAPARAPELGPSRPLSPRLAEGSAVVTLHAILGVAFGARARSRPGRTRTGCGSSGRALR